MRNKSGSIQYRFSVRMSPEMEIEDNRDERLSYQLEAGKLYYLFVGSNEPDIAGDFTLFSHYGACGAVPPPACDNDVVPIGTGLCMSSTNASARSEPATNLWR